MRYSAVSLWEAAGTRKVQKYLQDKSVNVEESCRYRTQNIKMIPHTDEEIKFDEAMAKVATDMAMERHVGIVESVYTPMGIIYSQVGKDLLEINYFIGTGGVLVHSKYPTEILKAGTFDMSNPSYLKPQHPGYLLDKTYIMSAMGLLAEDFPDMAVRIMKKYLVALS
jgi:uncharacterized protein (TIGR01319 family)